MDISHWKYLYLNDAYIYFFFLPPLHLLTDGLMVAHSCTQTGTVVR